MNRYAFAFVISLFVCQAYAQEVEQQRIPDLSLSPEETLNRPDISHSPDGNYGMRQNPYYNNRNNNGYNPQEAYDSGTSSRFMTGYCDPNFKPLVANAPGLSGLQSCMETQKQQTCDAFQHLPSDVQAALDSVISCLQSDSDTAEGQRASDDPGCTSGDTQRLNLLKKYWGNEAITHALVFMPDEIMNASGKCMHGSK